MDFNDQRILLGKRIADARKRQGLTQKQLALMAGLNHGYLSEVENGTGNISINKLFALADALDVPAASLLAED